MKTDKQAVQFQLSAALFTTKGLFSRSFHPLSWTEPCTEQSCIIQECYTPNDTLYSIMYVIVSTALPHIRTLSIMAFQKKSTSNEFQLRCISFELIWTQPNLKTRSSCGHTTAVKLRCSPMSSQFVRRAVGLTSHWGNTVCIISLCSYLNKDINKRGVMLLGCSECTDIIKNVW